MRLSDGIERHGFRGWYERELGRGHLRLLLLVFAAIAFFSAIELFGRGTVGGKLGSIVLVVVAGAIGALALRRYLHLLGRAEFVANQAVCPSCRTYGRIRLDAGRRDEAALPVRCAKCDASWQICDPGEKTSDIV